MQLTHQMLTDFNSDPDGDAAAAEQPVSAPPASSAEPAGPAPVPVGR